ncbi:MAG: hypothetical protein ACOY90_05655 [Candidatus Zhuqueibacterota bacterium]
MKYNHIGIPTSDRFEGEIDLPHLKITVSDHTNNPFGIQWMGYREDSPYPELVKTVPHDWDSAPSQAFFWLDDSDVPAPAQVTQAVGQ